MRQCYHCKRWFKNKQAIRAHLRWCPERTPKKRGSFILPPGTVNPYEQPKSKPNKMAPNYPTSSGGGFTDELHRTQREASANPSTQELIKPAKVCPTHYDCMICPHCGAHLYIPGARGSLVPFRGGICLFCNKVFLY